MTCQGLRAGRETNSTAEQHFSVNAARCIHVTCLNFSYALMEKIAEFSLLVSTVWKASLGTYDLSCLNYPFAIFFTDTIHVAYQQKLELATIMTLSYTAGKRLVAVCGRDNAPDHLTP
jgi:hypothetical protein